MPSRSSVAWLCVGLTCGCLAAALAFGASPLHDYIERRVWEAVQEQVVWSPDSPEQVQGECARWQALGSRSRRCRARRPRCQLLQLLAPAPARPPAASAPAASRHACLCPPCSTLCRQLRPLHAAAARPLPLPQHHQPGGGAAGRQARAGELLLQVFRPLEKKLVLLDAPVCCGDDTRLCHVSTRAATQRLDTMDPISAAASPAAPPLVPPHASCRSKRWGPTPSRPSR